LVLTKDKVTHFMYSLLYVPHYACRRYFNVKFGRISP